MIGCANIECLLDIFSLGNDLVFLECQTSRGMLSAIDEVHIEEWHLTGSSDVGGEFPEVFEEFRMLYRGSGLSGSHRDTNNGIATKAGFVRCAIKLDHGLIQCVLVAGVHADDGFCEFAMNVDDCLEYAGASKSLRITVAKLERFVGSGRST